MAVSATVWECRPSYGSRRWLHQMGAGAGGAPDNRGAQRRRAPGRDAEQIPRLRFYLIVLGYSVLGLCAEADLRPML
ncbi:hypothetical protein RB213_008021 [Colletotrichum asianum]